MVIVFFSSGSSDFFADRFSRGRFPIFCIIMSKDFLDSSPEVENSPRHQMRILKTLALWMSGRDSQIAFRIYDLISKSCKSINTFLKNAALSTAVFSWLSFKVIKFSINVFITFGILSGYSYVIMLILEMMNALYSLVISIFSLTSAFASFLISVNKNLITSSLDLLEIKSVANSKAFHLISWVVDSWTIERISTMFSSRSLRCFDFKLMILLMTIDLTLLSF